MTFDPNKPYTRRDKDKAEILGFTIDGRMWVRHFIGSQKENVILHQKNGREFGLEYESEFDLINVPEEMYVNVYEYRCSKGKLYTTDFYNSENEAKKEHLDCDRIYIGTYKLVKVGE